MNLQLKRICIFIGLIFFITAISNTALASYLNEGYNGDYHQE